MFIEQYQRMEATEYSDEALGLLYDLMGEDVKSKKEFIFNNIDFSEVTE